MLLRDILADIKIEDVKESLKSLYFQKEDFNGKIYEELFDQLKSVSFIPSESNMTLHVEFTEDCGSNECIWSATYSLDRRYTRKYSLEFATPEQIANAFVKESDIENCLNKEGYLSHILREKLYYSDSEEEELEIRAEERKRRRKTKNEYCSIEEILTSLEEETFDE